MFLLLDDTQHQSNQSHTSDEHQKSNKQFTVIPQSRSKIQTGTYRTQRRHTLKQKCHDRCLRFPDCQNKHKYKQNTDRHHYRRIGTANGIVRKFTAKYFHPLRTAQHSNQIQYNYCKRIHLDTTRRGLCSTAHPHQEDINQYTLYSQRSQVHACKPGSTRTSRIKERLCPFISDGHTGKSMIPLKNSDKHRTKHQ